MFENIQGRNQIFTAIVVSFAYASVGCNFAWTSPILPRLMEKDSKIPITEEQGSWVASLLAIGATVSPLMSCKLLDSLGRKNTLLLNTVLLLLGWTLIWLAYCLEILYVGRIITGLACGIFFLGLPMYIIEITESTMYEQMQKKAGIKDLIKVPGNRKGLWINFFLVTAGQFTGINVIQLYSELIFMKSGSNIPPKYCAMTVGTFQFISSLFAPSISKTFGYRKPLLLGAVIIGIEYFFMGLYFYFDHLGHDMSQWGWLPVICLVIFMLTFSSTYGPIPWAVLGETFPANVKVLASALATSLCLLDTFILTKFFTNVSEIVGIYCGFWIFSISMIISFLFVYFILPETKGMSLQEIQDILNKPKPPNKDQV
ncbi:facilitated trehalose transporter Tret1-like isoform X2 [Lycorma delicatula]|uniref:facilitated trehalose transporter Tret1-like isoform X2 n=1 Tax=Lycorma delicatula TaxID=130591 RepID=UPI003F50E417